MHFLQLVLQWHRNGVCETSFKKIAACNMPSFQQAPQLFGACKEYAAVAVFHATCLARNLLQLTGFKTRLHAIAAEGRTDLYFMRSLQF